MSFFFFLLVVYCTLANVCLAVTVSLTMCFFCVYVCMWRKVKPSSFLSGPFHARKIPTSKRLPYGGCYCGKQSKKVCLWTQVAQTELRRRRWSTRTRTHTHTPRILDSYQRESEIRKLKSLFPLSHSACFLSKQTASSRPAFRSPLWNSLTSSMGHAHTPYWKKVN